MKPDVLVELKSLRLHGMAGAWADLVEQGGNAGIETSRWLIEHLLQAEATDRAVRSVNYQMGAAKFPAHRDLANPVHRSEVARLWGIADVPATPGKTAVEMFEAAADGQIKALWIACTNPAQSMPD